MGPWSLDASQQQPQMVHDPKTVPKTVQQLTEFKLTPLSFYSQQTITTKLAS